jgi:hypothetical protein
MVMLVVIVGMGLAALMLPLVLVQTHTTTFDSTRGRALQAAESGIDIAVGKIRAAGTADPTGKTGLPCGPLPKAAVGAGALSGQYDLKIDYFMVDPSQAGATALPCPVVSPRFAQITATGYAAGDVRTRTLVTTYEMSIAVKQTSGPADLDNSIWFYIGKQPYCLTFKGGNQLAFDSQPCNATSSSTQDYIYSNAGNQGHTGLLIRLMDNSCLYLNGNSDHLVSNGCNGNTDNLEFYVTLTGLLEGYKHEKCPNVSQPPNGVLIEECPKLEDGIVTTQPWIMGTRMGIRRAAGQPVDGNPSMQIINGWQYSRCLSVQPDADPMNLKGADLIAYSCAQQNDLTSSSPWQQAFSYSNSQLKVCGGDGCTGGVKCVASPRMVGGYVTLVDCNPNDPSQTWAKGDISKNYPFIDADGRCLSLDLYGEPYESDYAHAMVAKCDGTDLQAWDVPDSWANPGGGHTPVPPPVLSNQAQLKDLHEK